MICGYYYILPVPVAAPSKAQVDGRSYSEWVRIPPEAWMFAVLTEVSATGLSLVQGSPTDCGGSLCVI